jgi:hypothetical protein
MWRTFLIVLLLAVFVSGATGQSQQQVVEFAGLIQKGPTYRAQISYDKEQGWRTVVKLRVPYHHAARVEWVNLNEYPVLDKPDERSRKKRIVFELESREVVKVSGQERWNTTYRCRIIAVE